MLICLSKYLVFVCCVFVFCFVFSLLSVYSDLPCYILWKTSWPKGLSWSQVNPNKTASKNSKISVIYNKTEAVLLTECNFADVRARRCTFHFSKSEPHRAHNMASSRPHACGESPALVQTMNKGYLTFWSGDSCTVLFSETGHVAMFLSFFQHEKNAAGSKFVMFF